MPAEIESASAAEIERAGAVDSERELWPNRTLASGQIWLKYTHCRTIPAPNSAEIRPMLVNLGPKLIEFGPISVDSASMFAEPG